MSRVKCSCGIWIHCSLYGRGPLSCPDRCEDACFNAVYHPPDYDWFYYKPLLNNPPLRQQPQIISVYDMGISQPMDWGSISSSSGIIGTVADNNIFR